MDKFNQLKALIDGTSSDAEAFFGKNNKAAGVRLRSVLQKTKVLAQEIRLDISAKKNKN